MSAVILYDFWRSSASYRVRIALNLAAIDYKSAPVDLTKGDHKSKEHIRRNPQGFVPALHIDGHLLTQSLAIVEYLNETRPGLNFLPAHPAERGHVRAIAYAIAMDIHPICNLGVVNHVMDMTGGGDPVRLAWMQKFIGEGLAAVEAMLQMNSGSLCVGDTPTLADICLLPQVYNARRWDVNLTERTRINGIVERLEVIEAFAKAHPDRVKPG
jgi:maleylacetoacetate isomerase